MSIQNEFEKNKIAKGRFYKAQRAMLGLRQIDVAEAIGTSQGFLSQIEIGNKCSERIEKKLNEFYEKNSQEGTQ